MAELRFAARAYPITDEIRWRQRFSILAVLTSVALLGWGAFVTSINAGLAVPDWPTSFNSYDPFNPWPEWWKLTPVLAEHGHRLIGALVGLFTLILAFWTWWADPRSWMRKLGFVALFLVILQGILGGLRVVWVSLDLAVVHACLAQVFFSLLVALALFTSKPWLHAESVLDPMPHTKRLRIGVTMTIAALYVQIIFGALLRHPGTGIDPILAGIHMTWAFVVAGLVLLSFNLASTYFRTHRLLRQAASVMLGLLMAQILLGFMAYFVLLDEVGVLRPSNLQVLVNSSHLVVGGLLMASTVGLALVAFRRPANVGILPTQGPPFDENKPQPSRA